ncbi:MAG: exodeoxyribonuclease VII large subunit [Candidatus Rokuibacteriota bacterium]|nr:MAG: exodeoxyribonuclease VII large subunit [Candidatus Rokubacteria bacterium]PYO04309.1 MAG: exodeoxyribonuclease VII large subunit [Candidatus Rokubacteria bacterium]
MSTGRAVLTVSELTRRLQEVLEDRFPAVWVEGEISNFRLYGSGHAYFTLKDADAQVRAVLFRNRGRRIKFEPADGLHVMAFGSIEVYPQRGEYQMVIELLEPKGLGALQLAFEQLKTRLQAEGLFEQARKRELPRFPRKIGIVTSPSGAAIRDMLRVIGRRFGELHIVIAPCRVQGEGAAEEIAQGLRDLNALGGVDVIIVGRGGGSLEDLWAFNEEIVARAIAGSKVPVVSAIGHEVDFTIADFVADLRAPTPSAAAELVVREKQAVVDSLGQLRARLERFAARPLRDLERRVDELTARLRREIRSELGRANHRVVLVTRALRASDPVARVANDRHRLENLQSRLITSLTRRCDHARYGLRTAVGRLDSLSPLAVLGRGYSLTRTPTGEVVHSPAQVQVGDGIRVLLHRGSLDARVTDTREQDDRPQV